jgi:glutaminyl-tRNA synthetase
MSKEAAAIDTEFYKKVGFEDKTLKQIAKNKELADKIKDIYTKKNVTESNENKSSLIYTLYSSNNADITPRAEFISENIFNGKINNKQQLKLAETFFAKHKANFEVPEFEKFCGVGVVIGEKEIAEYVEKFIAENMDKLKKVDYKVVNPDFLNPLKDGLPLANPAALLKFATDYVKEKFANVPKEEKPAPEKKKEEAPKKAEKAEDGEDEPNMDEFQKIDISKLAARNLADSLNDEETLKKHRTETGGKVITRFPPEPNGILHIGHCRAIRFNFSIAGLYKGDCNLRYDDTNPEKEKKEFMDMIEANVKWMGFTPTKILHASQYFPQIYDWTLQLIRMGKAYVCKLPTEVGRDYREKMIPSPFRDTTPEVNLKEFELMKAGYYAEGEAVLRAKIDYKSPVTTLRDPVLYRILYTPHPVSGTQWCIYPMYDYAHPLSDSIENITHSCCTLEFETRRELYYWPLKELNLYKPFVWEFSRLNIAYTLTSKRKILQLIADNVVKGWDDPRLYTIDGLRRRGIPLEALNDFLDRVPVTRKGNDNYIQLSLFDFVVKSHLDELCPRSLAVSDPVHLEITNIPATESTVLQAPVFPRDPSKGTYPVTLERHVYVDAKDVSLEEPKSLNTKNPEKVVLFYGIAPGKIVRLKYGPAIKITSVEKTPKGLNVKAERLSEEEAAKLKIKGVLNWISKKDGQKCELRLYSTLFQVPVPKLDASDPESRRKELNPDSLKICPNALVNKHILKDLKKDSKFQFERLGFFSVDYDTDIPKGKYVFNLILQSQSKLKDDEKGKDHK